MLKQEINGQIKYAQDIVDAFDKAAKGAAANHQAKNGAKKAADDGGDVQYSAMYKSKLHGIEEYYDFVHTNKDNPSERNKSYYTAKMDDGSTIDVLFDVLIHTYNRHALTKPQVCAILDGLDGDILSANVGDGSKSSFNGTPVKLKVSTSEGTAGVLIDMLDNGRNIMRTCFFDSEERIDEWKEKNGFKALTSLQTKESGFLDNRLYISIIRRSLGKSTGKSSIQEVLGTDAQKKRRGPERRTPTPLILEAPSAVKQWSQFPLIILTLPLRSWRQEVLRWPPMALM